MRRNKTNHQRTILKHLQKIQTMVNVPSRKKPVIIVESDSDDQYYDDYILRQSQSSSSQDQSQLNLDLINYNDKSLPKIVTLNDIEKLPDCKIKSNDEVCSICLQFLQQQSAQKILPCAHKYHYSCVRDWLIIKNKCPTCNKIVFL